MRKLIDISQEILIQCDNKACNYRVLNTTGDATTDSAEYINQPCPRCGHNLLTQADYDQYQRLIRFIEKMNRWFGWLTLFMPDRGYTRRRVHVHNGIHLTDTHKQTTPSHGTL